MMKKRVLGIVAASLVTLSIFAGCTSKTEEVKKESGKKVVSTVKGDVEIPTSPKRIADISGSTEELMILGHTTVATANADAYITTEFPSYMKDKMRDSKIVGFSMSDTMDVEAILKTEPDLIIMSERQVKIYDQLKAIAPVVVMKDYANDWRTKLIDVSKLFGEESLAKEWLGEYDKKSGGIGKEILEKNGKKSYLTVLASAGQFYIFSNAAMGSILYDDMKLEKPANMPPQEGISLPVVTMEGLSKIDADHIIAIATDADKKDLESSLVWKSMRAVKEGNVTILESSPYFNQGYNPTGRELLLELIKGKVMKK
jgi:iron complex transport system substrate-binding protein